MIFDGQSYVPGQLNSGLWKLGVYLLTYCAVLTVTVLWWFFREPAPGPARQ